jgi:hypothetical protein
MNKSIPSAFSATALCAAVALAATAASSESAAYTAYVSSNITGMQMWAGSTDLLSAEPGGYFSGFSIGGTADDNNYDGFVDSANLYLQGEVGFVANGISIRLEFDLAQGSFTPGAGMQFYGGEIRIFAGEDGTYVPYATIDASVQPQAFLAGQPIDVNQVTAGIVRNTLPGLWDGVPDSAGYNRAAGQMIVLGQTVGIFLQGEVVPYTLDVPGAENGLQFGPAEVPVPAAAWLFGSGLAGLAGARRLRRWQT